MGRVMLSRVEKDKVFDYYVNNGMGITKTANDLVLNKSAVDTYLKSAEVKNRLAQLELINMNQESGMLERFRERKDKMFNIVDRLVNKLEYAEVEDARQIKDGAIALRQIFQSATDFENVMLKREEIALKRREVELRERESGKKMDLLDSISDFQGIELNFKLDNRVNDAVEEVHKDFDLGMD